MVDVSILSELDRSNFAHLHHIFDISRQQFYTLEQME